jgi:hypothetical protein
MDVSTPALIDKPALSIRDVKEHTFLSTCQNINDPSTHSRYSILTLPATIISTQQQKQAHIGHFQKDDSVAMTAGLA